MKKKLLVSALFLSAFSLFSQDDKKAFIHKGLLRSMATISPGILVTENVSTISLHGNLEYYVADNVSLRGDTYYFLSGKSNDSDPVFEFNHTTFSGASWHMTTKGNFDPYLAFEPGISVAKSGSPELMILPGRGQTTVNPLLSSALGFNLYFQRWFHLFAEARYINGKFLSNASPLSLNELKFSFGLGWNIGLLKKKG